MVAPRHFIIIDNTRRDRQEEASLRKRQRVESDDEEIAARSKHVNSSPQPTVHVPGRETAERDPIYFNSDVDATIIIKVSNVLFKVHRQMLGCCDIMSACLKDHEEQHGATTEFNPLVFLAPTLDEYRAFLWAIYATAEELKVPPASDQDLNRLFDAATLGSKYYITKLEQWVAYSIAQAANNSALMESCSSATLTRFVNVAVSQKYISVLGLVIDKWCERLLVKSTPSVPAIQIVDRHENLARDEINKLRGIAYYVHIQDMLDRQGNPTESGATHLRTDPKLNNGQVMRLLAGYWSLASLWERLRLNPVDLPADKNCAAEVHSKCRSTWERRWTSAAGWKRILGHNSADILALLNTLQDQLSNDDDLREGVATACRKRGLVEIKQLRESIQGSLADHFKGLP